MMFGEMPLARKYRYITDSGRSSLRFILPNLTGTIAVPDFTCKVIIDILDELHVKYNFYHVNPDLTIDEKTIKGDFIYTIDYFGKRFESDLFTIEDAVFLPVLTPRRNWIGFNSFRKISPLADGSFIESSVKLEGHIYEHSDFQEVKYRAKNMKYHGTNGYLDYFNLAEKMLDNQTKPRTIYPESVMILADFMKDLEKEYEQRRKNYQVLKDILGGIDLDTDYPSFFVMNTKNRDRIKSKLYKEKIYLPSFWPKIGDNTLYDTLLAIPVSGYSEKQMEIVGRKIRRIK